MFTDPITVTVNAVAQVMPRVSNSGQKSVYQKADTTFSTTISHTPNKDRVRSMFRVDQRAIVPDPLTAVNDWETLGIYLVIDRPIIGFTSTQVNDLVAGMKTWLDSTNVGKLYGQES